jgi:hypothetical protein
MKGGFGKAKRKHRVTMRYPMFSGGEKNLNLFYRLVISHGPPNLAYVGLFSRPISFTQWICQGSTSTNFLLGHPR